VDLHFFLVKDNVLHNLMLTFTQAIEDEAYESADEADDEQVQAALEAQTADVDATASANGASWLSWAKNPMFATSSTKAPKAA